jgi:RND family efflux transporter MFP subunit
MIRVDCIAGAFGAGLLLACCAGCPAQRATSAQEEHSANNNLTTVKTLLPERTSLRRTTTQPATVHAYYQAEMYAKVGGYLKELNADIGQQVDAGTVLATIAVPELVKSRQRQEATVRHMQADEKRAEAGITVAGANVESAAAALEQARADVSSADAQLKADRIEHARVSDLVQHKAVAERLGDEALKRYESAQATKLSAEAAVVSADAIVSVANAKREAARADLDAARALTEVAIKELEELDALMAYATLRAPFKGVVTRRNTDPGDLIRNAPASGPDSPPLFVVAELDKVRVRVALPERDAPWANVGDPATLTFLALPGESFSGKVSRIAGSLDEDTRTMVVEIDLENPAHKLLPGMFGEATIELDEKADALILPAGAVRYDEEGHSRVYVVDQNNRVKLIDVSTGLDDGKRIEILSGLDENARVIAAMVTRLAPGQQVRIQAD